MRDDRTSHFTQLNKMDNMVHTVYVACDSFSSVSVYSVSIISHIITARFKKVGAKEKNVGASKKMVTQGIARSRDFFLFGSACMVCPLAPLPDDLSITATEVRTIQRSVCEAPLVLTLPAWLDGGVLLRTRLLETPTGTHCR